MEEEILSVLKEISSKRRGKPKEFVDHLIKEDISPGQLIELSSLPGDLSALGNGGSWCRDDAWRGYGIKITRIKSSGKITHLKYEIDSDNEYPHTQSINPKIREKIKNLPCVNCGTKTNIETDHKNGRKNGPEMRLENQVLSDFQPLCRHCNLIKRERCKECKKTDIRYKATLLHYVYNYTCGDENYTEEVGCRGCYWYDPVEFKKKISEAKTNLTF